MIWLLDVSKEGRGGERREGGEKVEHQITFRDIIFLDIYFSQLIHPGR